MSHQYNGPQFSDGPFCVVRVYRTLDGLQTYTYIVRSEASVLPANTRVNMLVSNLKPTWMIPSFGRWSPR